MRSSLINLFNSGADGYHTYRIPSLLMSPGGTLLAFCEGRRNSSADYGDIDLVLKRSEDSGETWSEQQLIYREEGEIAIGNSCPVVDRDTATIWLPFCRNNHDVLVTHSSDDGLTWAQPTDITAGAKKEGWTWYATGPGISIQLKRGAHKGRLVIPCDHQFPDGYGSGSHAIYSDDHGRTWQAGAPIQPGGDECQVVELEDGRLLMNMRMENRSEGYRALARSEDGAETWSKPTYDENLPCPVCQASFIRDGNHLLFSNPVPPGLARFERGDRVNLTVRASDDEGRSWPAALLLHQGPSAYSCLCALPDGDIGCLFEGGEKMCYERIIYARFSF